MSSESDSDSSSASSSSRYSSSTSSSSASSSESAPNSPSPPSSPREDTGRRYKCTECQTYTADVRGNVVMHIRVRHFGLPSTFKAQREQGIKDDRDAHAFIEDTYATARKRKRDILAKRNGKMAKKFKASKGTKKMKMHPDKEQKSAKKLKRPKPVIDSRPEKVAKPKEKLTKAKKEENHCKSKPVEKLTKSKSAATPNKSKLINQSIKLLTAREIMLSKPFTCTFNDCLEQLSTLNKWKSHIRDHLGIRPFCCIWRNCRFKSSSKSEVYTHVRVKHFKLSKCRKVQQRKKIVDNRDALDHVRTRQGALDCLLPQQEIYEPWLLQYLKPSKKNPVSTD